MKPANLYDTLVQSALRYPGAVAAVDAEETATYAGLRERVDATAAFLYHELGVRPGQSVAMLQSNSIAFCAHFYAILKLGCTALVLNTKLQPFELRTLLATGNPAVLLLDARWWHKARELCGGDSGIKHLVFTCNKAAMKATLKEGGAAPEGVRLYPRERVANCEEGEAPRHDGGAQTALVLFTSGSTGDPKGVQLSHANLLASAKSYVDTLGLGPDETTVLSVPAFHVTGLVCIMALFVYIGGKIIYRPHFNAADTLAAIETHRVTHFHAVATVYLLLKEELQTGRGYDLSALRMALCGGGPVSETTIWAIKRYAPHLDFRPAYGLTETAGAGVVFPCDYAEANKSGSAGKVVAGCRLTIRDENDTPLPTGRAGEICVEGAMVTKGYLGREPFAGGVLRTGDYGRLDEDGFVFIMDRLKDLINRGGDKVYSLEVESLIVGMPGVLQAAVFGIPDPLYGEVPVAAVVPVKGARLAEDEVLAYLREKIAKYKLPTGVVFMQRLPAAANGKVLKNVLREQYAAGTLYPKEASSL